jgi:hypothetical protein
LGAVHAPVYAGVSFVVRVRHFCFPAYSWSDEYEFQRADLEAFALFVVPSTG